MVPWDDGEREAGTWEVVVDTSNRAWHQLSRMAKHSVASVIQHSQRPRMDDLAWLNDSRQAADDGDSCSEIVMDSKERGFCACHKWERSN